MNHKKTLSNALQSIGASYEDFSIAIAKATSACNGFAPLINSFNPLRFGVHPKHKVSNQTIKQLKSILRGRKSLQKWPKTWNKKTKKKVDQAFKNGNVIWNTPENGLTELTEMYSQVGK